MKNYKKIVMTSKREMLLSNLFASIRRRLTFMAICCRINLYKSNYALVRASCEPNFTFLQKLMRTLVPSNSVAWYVTK